VDMIAAESYYNAHASLTFFSPRSLLILRLLVIS